MHMYICTYIIMHRLMQSWLGTKKTKDIQDALYKYTNNIAYMYVPEGKCRVLGPAFFMNLLTSLMLANVPLAITASLPRRAP